MTKKTGETIKGQWGNWWFNISKIIGKEIVESSTPVEGYIIVILTMKDGSES